MTGPKIKKPLPLIDSKGRKSAAQYSTHLDTISDFASLGTSRSLLVFYAQTNTNEYMNGKAYHVHYLTIKYYRFLTTFMATHCRCSIGRIVLENSFTLFTIDVAG